MQRVKVELFGATGNRSTEIQPKGFTTRHIQRRSVIETPPAVITPEPMSVTPKMPSEQHQNDRFLTGIKATLKVSGKWLTAPEVFTRFYDKYNLINVHDIEIGLDILAKSNEIESNVVEGENQFHLPTSDFERLLNLCQVSKYHLAEITGIDEAVMCGYCKGTKINTADAHRIADKLNLEPSELEGMVEVQTDLTALLAEVDAVMGVQSDDV